MDIDVVNLGSHGRHSVADALRLRAHGLSPLRREATEAGPLTFPKLKGLHSQAVICRECHEPLLPGEIGCCARYRAACRRRLDQSDGLSQSPEDDVAIYAGRAVRTESGATSTQLAP